MKCQRACDCNNETDGLRSSCDYCNDWCEDYTEEKGEP